MNKIITTIAAIVLLVSCSKGKTDIYKIYTDPGFSTYINAFTSGVVSSESSIKVILIEPYPEAKAGEPLNRELFSFEPGIEGEAYWLDNQTIEYRPKSPLISGKSYKVDFRLSKLLNVPDKYENLEFGFTVLKQRLSVSFEGMKATNEDFSEQKLFGKVKTSDLVDPLLLQKTVTA